MRYTVIVETEEVIRRVERLVVDTYDAANARRSVQANYGVVNFTPADRPQETRHFTKLVKVLGTDPEK